MTRFAALFFSLALLGAAHAGAARFASDTLKTASGAVRLTFIGHGTLMIEYGATVIHIDPVSQYADYSLLPKADYILVTHAHGDHLDLQAIASLRKENTRIIAAAVCREKLPEALILKNGEKKAFGELVVEAVPAYNIKNLRPNGAPFHPKGEGNGYVIANSGLRIYVAGDTEVTPEMQALANIDVAFLPMNLPYTMTPAMVAEAALAFRPHILYPYHYGDSDVQQLVKLLEKEKAIEVRIRELR